LHRPPPPWSSSPWLNPPHRGGHDCRSEGPRASLHAYIDDGRAGEWEKAARYLVLPESRTAEGPVLAERLKAVLDNHVWFDLEKISPA
jgi:MscS family membrane protein